MKIKSLCKLALAGLLGLILTACETASLEAPGSDKGQGAVTDFSIEPNTRVALYSRPTQGEAPPELSYGSMDAHFVTIDNVTYMVDWNDVADFKSLKNGDKIFFKATGKLARKEKTGQNYKVILLNEM